MSLLRRYQSQAPSATPKPPTIKTAAPPKISPPQNSAPKSMPIAKPPKIGVYIRLDADIVERFRAGGKGWQTRINAALRG